MRSLDVMVLPLSLSCRQTNSGQGTRLIMRTLSFQDMVVVLVHRIRRIDVRGFGFARGIGDVQRRRRILRHVVGRVAKVKMIQRPFRAHCSSAGVSFTTIKLNCAPLRAQAQIAAICGDWVYVVDHMGNQAPNAGHLIRSFTKLV
ncbi:MAG: hypothetical protein HY360_11985 [Verrucomicrobia bacterium]|nr:hypothetical protein [Verrucomicrobiota bacterium]